MSSYGPTVLGKKAGMIVFPNNSNDLHFQDMGGKYSLPVKKFICSSNDDMSGWTLTGNVDIISLTGKYQEIVFDEHFGLPMLSYFGFSKNTSEASINVVAICNSNKPINDTYINSSY